MYKYLFFHTQFTRNFRKFGYGPYMDIYIIFIFTFYHRNSKLFTIRSLEYTLLLERYLLHPRNIRSMSARVDCFNFSKYQNLTIEAPQENENYTILLVHIACTSALYHPPPLTRWVSDSIFETSFLLKKKLLVSRHAQRRG